MEKETLEYDILQHIKMCLECNNESQAIRLLEKYGFEKQEKMYSEEEVIWALLLCSNSKFQNSLEVKEWWNNFKNK